MEVRDNNGIAGNTTGTGFESQSSQLLNFVLGRAADPCQNARNVTNEENTSNDRQSGNSWDVSLSSASVMPYHFHGLVSTQTQTQFVEGVDSQKENTPAQGQNLMLSAPAFALPSTLTNNPSTEPSRRVQPSSKSLSSSRALSTGPSAPLSSRVPPLQTKAVTFLSPVRKAPEQKAPSNVTSMRFRRRRSASLSSQDSFAGPSALQDPDLFIATSKQFERPLEELGHPYSQEQTPSQCFVEEEPMKKETNSRLNPRIGSAETKKYSLSSTSSIGHILVADSDSSGPSQDSQQNHVTLSQEATQLLDTADLSMSEHNDKSDISRHVVDSTQLQHTQASTQEPTQPASFPLQDVQARRDGTAKPFVPSIVQPSVASNPHSILSLVPPEKRYRYMHHFGKNSVTTSEASRFATVGTSTGSENTRGERPPLALRAPTPDEEIVQDSEQQIEPDLSSKAVVRNQNVDQEVIPPSESDVPDTSRGEPEEEEEEEPLEMPLTKPASLVLEKGKQKERRTPRDGPSLKATSTRPQKETIARKERTSMVVSPSKNPKSVPSKLSPILVPSVKPLSKASSKPASNAVSVRNKDKVVKDAKSPSEAQKELPARRGRGRPRGSAKGKSKGREITAISTRKTASRTSRQEAVRAQTPAVVASESEEEPDSPDIPLAQALRVEEEETEIADDEQIESDEIADERQVNAPGPGASARKRKRGGTAAVVKKEGRGKIMAKRSGIREASAGQPPAKKQRRTPMPASEAVVKRFGAGLGTQVFALFKNDSCYYGAEVHAIAGNRAHVKFFGGLEELILGVTQMRKFELKIGDTIIPGNGNHKAKIIDDSPWASENEACAEYLEGPDVGLDIMVTADKVRIPARIVQSQWKDRLLEISDIIPAVGRKLLRETPSPSKMSVMSAMSSRVTRNKLLSKYGFVITFGPGDWKPERDRLIFAIKDSGGTIFDDWLDIFSLQGKHTYSNKRWTLKRQDVKYIKKDNRPLDRVYLISNVTSQKPKFLLALALGIPCVSVEWVEKLLKGEDEPWMKFLLPAGRSEPLSAPVSQMVDLDWGTTAEHLTEIMENMVPHKVLSGALVLCVGTDLLPLPPKKILTEADRALESSRTVPRIILSMGAESVEAVADAKHASEPDLTRYDYVVVREPPTSSLAQNAAYVDVTWIKDCLIAGRLLPLPEWG